MLVYLDSQDYSRLTDPRHASAPALQSAAQKIRRSADSGAHQYPFSNLHVQEAVHHDDRGKELAVGRARFMNEISHKNVFAPLEQLIQIEVASALRELGVEVCNARTYGDVVRNDGIWWPWEFMAEEGRFDLKSEALAPASADFMRTADRKQRRAFQRNLHALEKRAMQATMKDVASFVKNLVEAFPESPKLRDQNFIRSFLLGKVDKSEFYNAMMVGALDLETYVGWVIDRMDSGKGTANYLKVCGYELATKLEVLLASFNFPARFKGNHELEEAYERARMAHMNSMADGLRRALVGMGAKLLAENGCIQDAEKVITLLHAYTGSSMPGIDVCRSCCAVWIGLLTAPSESRQKPLRSDVLDMLHAIYLPYVDVFRADARFTNILRQTKTSHFSKVESSLEKLEILL